MKKMFLAIIVLLMGMATDVAAQVEMADNMRKEGKIYVVVVVLATIFAGIFAYLVYIDKKITRIERDK